MGKIMKKNMYPTATAIPTADYLYTETPPTNYNNTGNLQFNNISLATQFNEAGARQFLSSNKWPIGLQDTLIANLHKIPKRFFICDDSGSVSKYWLVYLKV
jgi:hypothetical protein